ncbi:MAG: hypothetical protein IKE25_03570, partial [Clostridia bacterium]|nr:hypothetical protein [Clostridia bacterium]
KKGKSGYEYLETQLTAYRKQSMAAVELADCRDVTEYIRYAKSIENSAVLMAVCDEGTDALTEEQKKKMEEDGLGKLARLNYRDSYVAYIQDGEVVFEMDQRDADSAENADASLSVDFLLPRKQRVNMQSCGTGHGDAFSSITVDGVEYCLNQRGINIVVYDYLNGAVVNSTCFDTCVSPYREADYETRYAHALKNGTPADAMDEKLRELYLYNRRYDNWKQVYQWRTESSSMSFFSWLEPWISSKGYTVFISVMDEASDSLTEDNRDGMLGLGLAALSGIEYRDSYIGIINDGSVSYEELDHGYEPIEWSGVDCLVKSGGMDSGNVSSVMICGNEYSISMRGLNCVVYDKELKEVVDTVAFDTFAAPIDMEYKMRDDFI